MFTLSYWRQFGLIHPAPHRVVIIDLKIIAKTSASHVLLVMMVIAVGIHCIQSLPYTVKLTLSGLVADLAIGSEGDVVDACCADAEEEGLVGAA